ncbi:hypothetical protein DPMN_149149 [Dreissena polymorpha]|uniref:Uncharacterized protein n=1 Tax=Dreissena polymorpha TaxID=45954 RepID=A0A9D4FAV5_DREPO|nr:hypothetical protein DPMN_149149 [Dreissena polymorpha]
MSDANRTSWLYWCHVTFLPPDGPLQSLRLADSCSDLNRTSDQFVGEYLSKLPSVGGGGRQNIFTQLHRFDVELVSLMVVTCGRVDCRHIYVRGYSVFTRLCRAL